MKKKLILGVVGIVILVAGAVFIFTSHDRLVHKDFPVEIRNEKTPEKAVSQLGLDFSNPVFAKQTKCYDNPFQLYSNPSINFRAICFYQDQMLGTAIFWARTKTITSPTDFVKRNVEVIAKDRAALGATDTASRSVVPLFEKNGISYHQVMIGKSYKAIEGTFFVHTKEADALGIVVVITVKGFGNMTEEQVIAKSEEMKAGVKLKMAIKIKHDTFSFFEKAFAQDTGDGDGGDSTGPALGSGTPGLGVTDGSGNAVGTGGGSSNASNGGGNGNGGGGGSGSNPDNGVCMPTHNNCSGGALGNVYENASVYEWWCMGTNGGTNVLCSENKVVPPTGSLSANPTSCQIATGASTCQTTLTWTTTNPQGTSGITRDGTAGLLYSGNTSPVGGQSANIPFDADGSVTYRLYNNAVELGFASVSVSCADGSFDTVGRVCANPKVVSAIVGGLYYPPGTIVLTCSNATSYSVTKGGASFVPVTTYTSPVSIPVSQEDNYVLKCIHGSVSDQVARFYDATPDPAKVSITISPVTIIKDGKITMSWKTQFPTNTCSLTAKVVCSNNACTASQTASQAVLDTILQTEKTDVNDPDTSRLISLAVKSVAPGHSNTDWLALGKKTLQISYTTDLTYSCGGTNKETKRVQVTKSELQ